MRQLQTSTFTSHQSLTGTLITSTSPIAVFAGNNNVTIGPGAIPDQTISQLLPSNLWGTRFALPSIPLNDNSGYSVIITSGSRTASVTAQGSSYLVNAGTAIVINVPSNAPMYIVSDAAVQVVQFVHGATVEEDSGAPASIIVPSTDLYLNSYTYVNPDGYINYLMITIDRSAINAQAGNSGTQAGNSGIVVDGGNVEAGQWVPIAGTNLVTKNVLLSKIGYSSVVHSGGEVFGALRYSYLKGNCAFAFPAGFKLSLADMVSCL